ncbi:MAG: septum formation initiator family protein [Rhizobacter sp.]|nr:septum formation initiator family protein [Chlorobiales bacterium]
MNHIQIFLSGLQAQIASAFLRAQEKFAATRYRKYFSKNFYRRIRVRSQLAALYDDIAQNPRRYFALTLSGLAVIYLLFGDYGLFARLKMEYRKHALTGALAAENRRTDSLRISLKRAAELDEIERIAREKYNLARKDETVYLLKK